MMVHRIPKHLVRLFKNFLVNSLVVKVVLFTNMILLKQCWKIANFWRYFHHFMVLSSWEKILQQMIFFFPMVWNPASSSWRFSFALLEINNCTTSSPVFTWLFFFRKKDNQISFFHYHFSSISDWSTSTLLVRDFFTIVVCQIISNETYQRKIEHIPFFSWWIFTFVNPTFCLCVFWDQLDINDRSERLPLSLLLKSWSKECIRACSLFLSFFSQLN